MVDHLSLQLSLLEALGALQGQTLDQVRDAAMSKATCGAGTSTNTLLAGVKMVEGKIRCGPLPAVLGILVAAAALDENTNGGSGGRSLGN